MQLKLQNGCNYKQFMPMWKRRFEVGGKAVERTTDEESPTERINELEKTTDDICLINNSETI